MIIYNSFYENWDRIFKKHKRKKGIINALLYS